MRAEAPLTAQELARRMPLWEALSVLYLDTEDAAFVPRVVEAAQTNGFSLEEVDHCLRWEVRPALYKNYLSVAGIWSGWEAERLREEICDAITRPPLFCRRPFRGACATWFMPAEWPAIQAAMAG
jgi:hypothetical protein